MNNKALIAMSGGVDSSVAAYLTAEMGYEIEGAIMKLFSGSRAQDVDDARSVCNILGINFHVLDFQKEFRDIVIEDFIRAYERGATPNPCIVCNKNFKFDKFLQSANSLGMDHMVTGHYARIEKDGSRYLLRKAEDHSKDQSYVLYSLTQRQLSSVIFPLGSLTKPQIREIAESKGFVTAHKSDSQDICFVPEGEYIKVIKEYSKKNYPKGEFVDVSGKVLGTHQGIINYTVGQRKGLGIAFGEKMYVKEKDAETNRVVLSSNDMLFGSTLDGEDFNWIAFENPPEKIECKAKIRYNSKPSDATVYVTGKDTVHVEFKEPQRAIAKGQAVVLYEDDVVLGGGTII